MGANKGLYAFLVAAVPDLGGRFAGASFCTLFARLG